jgi:hypothetical protein
MGLMITGLILFFIITVATANIDIVIFLLCAISYFFYIFGFIIMVCGWKRKGANLVFVSSFLFFPIGLIGIFGARKYLDELTTIDFLNKRRQNE